MYINIHFLCLIFTNYVHKYSLSNQIHQESIHWAFYGIRYHISVYYQLNPVLDWYLCCAISQDSISAVGGDAFTQATSSNSSEWFNHSAFSILWCIYSVPVPIVNIESSPVHDISCIINEITLNITNSYTMHITNSYIQCTKHTKHVCLIDSTCSF